MTETNSLPKKYQEQLSEKIMQAFDSVIAERSKYYKETKNTIPVRKDVSSIISHYSNQNTVISGTVGLIPGPWGMVAAIPEIVMIIRNQLTMIYDIGMAFGKEKILGKELLAGVFLSAFGNAGVSLLTVHGSKILVKRASLRVFQKIVTLMAGKVTQQMLKSMISKWLPIVGAAAMATWSNYSTRQIGKKAISIFEKEIEYSDEQIDEIKIEESVETEIPEVSLLEEENLEILKIQALINLMKIDKKIEPEEIDFINIVITNTVKDEQTKTELINSIASDTKYSIDFSGFANSPDETIGLLLDLIALSKRDGKIHIAEKLYIKQIGKLLSFSDTDIEEMMATE